MQVRLLAILAGLGYGSEAVHVAACLADAHRCLAAGRFAVLLVDVGLPDGSGVELIRDCRAAHNPASILVISAWRQEQVVLDALQAGANGYLLKERDDIEIALSLRNCLAGGAPIDPFLAKRILALATPVAASGPLPSAPQLTSREIEILGLVAKGLTNREISDVLALSKLTVEVHIKNIYRKLVVGSRTEAVFEARNHGLLS